MATRQINVGLPPEIVSDFYHVFEAYSEIERVLIFGSRARGTQRDGSDIDLAVVAPRMSDERFSELWNDVDEMPIVFKVDCVHFEALKNTRFKEKIVQEGRDFYVSKDVESSEL